MFFDHLDERNAMLRSISYFDNFKNFGCQQFKIIYPRKVRFVFISFEIGIFQRASNGETSKSKVDDLFI
jgi:hypothetical protein